MRGWGWWGERCDENALRLRRPRAEPWELGEGIRFSVRQSPPTRDPTAFPLKLKHGRGGMTEMPPPPPRPVPPPTPLLPEEMRYDLLFAYLCVAVISVDNGYL